MSGNFSNIRPDEEKICNSQPMSLPSSKCSTPEKSQPTIRPPKYTGQKGHFRSVEEIDPKYRHVFAYPYFNLVQSSVIDDALYSGKSMVVCAPTGSGKTVIFEMAILQLLMELEDKNNTDDYKIIYMAPVKALCTERITEWYSKFMKLGLLCIEVTGDTDVDFPQLKPYRIIITTPEKWDMLTRRWMEHNLVKVVKLLLIDEVHILNDEARGPVLEAVVSRMKTVESSVKSGVRLVAVSATISNPQDVAAWLGAGGVPAVHYKFGDEYRPVKLTRIVEGYPCSSGTSIFKFDIILNYKLWPIIQKYHNGKPTLIFCNTRKSVILTAETLSREITVSFSPEQRSKLTAVASTIKNKKIQSLVLAGVGCHHAGLLFEERVNIEQAFRNRDLPILITTTTLAMGVNLPAHLVIIKNTQQYVNGTYQEYSISTVLQMVGRAGRPQYEHTATAVIMTRLQDKARYQSLVDGCEPLQSFLHKRLAENINSEIALGTIGDVAQCVQWLNSTFLRVRAAKDPNRYLGLPSSAPAQLITKKIEELCVGAMNGLESSGLVTMDELSCIESTEAGRLMSLHYLDLETMKLIMKIGGSESLERLLWLVCESHELSDMHLRVDERRCLNALNRNNSAPTIRYQMKGKISTRQMKLNCVIQSVLGCLPIPDPSLNQEALKIMRTADRVCKCLVSYVTCPNLVSQNPKFYAAILNSLILAKCITAHLWENSLYVSRQLRGIGPTFSTLLASAGKTTFMILDESHPRDLERIMNKGPPAGNILRKQISLLPKYNVTITPVNELSIRVQLTLQNQSYLADNIESLTAGARHKSYIVVGDTENVLLYFSSFTDSDLINIYDGSMSIEVTRKHLQEHKVIAHCVSSSYVGIDDQCEYIFKDINPFPSCVEKNTNETVQKISPNRQTYITDVFKERKRKSNDHDSTQFKEKKKRDCLLIDKFKTLNKSFEKTSKDIKEKCNETKLKPVDNLVGAKPKFDNTPKVPEPVINEVNYEIDESDFLEDFEFEDIDNERINNLLNEIEFEVNKPSTSTNNSVDLNIPIQTGCNNNSKIFHRNKVNMKKKNNYTFIDRLEMKNSECENDDLTNKEDNISNKESGFSDTIKCHVQQYLQKAQNKFKCSLTSSIELDEKYINLEKLTSPESKEIVNEKDIDSKYLASSENKEIVHENDVQKNVLVSSGSKEIVHDRDSNSHLQKAQNNLKSSLTSSIELDEKGIASEKLTSSESKEIIHEKDINLKFLSSSDNKEIVHESDIQKNVLVSSESKEIVHVRDINSQNLRSSACKKIVHKKVIDSPHLASSENIEKVHKIDIGLQKNYECKKKILCNVINPQIIDLTKNVEEKQYIVTKSDENFDVINLTNSSPHANNYNRTENYDKCMTSKRTEKMLENNEFDLTEIENNINADEMICNLKDKDNSNNEYSLMPYIPRVGSPDPIKITPKVRTLKTSTNACNLEIQTSSDNLNHYRFFSSDCALIPCEQKFVSSKPMNTKAIQTFKKSLNGYNSNVKEKRVNFNKSSLCTVDSEQHNSNINIQNLNSGKNFKNIRKYSFNATKTINVHKENISKICTLKVALDVTEIVHQDDNHFDTQNDTINNIQNEHNRLSNINNIDTVLQIEHNTNNMKGLNTANNAKKKLNQKLQFNGPPNQISNKSKINKHIKNKEPTLRDILERYATRQNASKAPDTGLENCTTKINKYKKDPDFKHKRKYRISDLDTIDITLPESLVPSQNQFINNTPNYKSNERKLENESFTEEKLCTTTENTGTPMLSKTSLVEEVENNCDEEPKIDLNSYLHETVILPNFDLNPTVLDPKTLLQSLNNEEIIPPPPEFCDNDDYPISFPGPNTSNCNDISYNDSHHANAPPDNNIFATTFDDMVTETDTWISSKKDDDNLLRKPNSSYNTITQRNRNDFLQSRLSKLSQFKFKRKDMLRK